MFGLDKSKRAILDAHRAVICEGQLDLIACFMSGVKNIVAPQGTALTSDHVRILKRYVDEVVLCFDSDDAGQKAAVRSLDTLLASGLSIRVAAVPAPHDPDSFIKEFGGGAFAQLIENARGFFDYYLDRLCALHDAASDRGRRAIVQGMAEALHKTGSEVLRDTHAQKTALRLGVAAEAMRQEFRKDARGKIAESEEEAASSPALPDVSVQERWLLRLVLESDEQVEWVAAHLELEWVENAVVREIVARRLQTMDEWPGLAGWLSQLETPHWVSLITDVLSGVKAAPIEANLKGIAGRDGAIKILRDKHIERRLAALNRQLAAPDLPEAAQAEVLAETQHLRHLKKQPLSPKRDQ